MRVRVGAEVVVSPVVESDPYILQFQRFGTVSRVDGGVAWIRLSCALPRDQEIGPIPEARLLPGWRDERGRWRA